jgi:chromosome partitioning protein
MTRVIAITNQKGGVAKTTTAIHLGAALAAGGSRVLLADLDPQGHLAEGFGMVADGLECEMSDVLEGSRSLDDITISLAHQQPGLYLAPSNIRLADMELTLVNLRFREYRLKRALESMGSQFDYILLDCPPSLGLLTVNGLMAAGEVLIPMACEYYSMLGVSLLLKTVAAIKAEANPDLAVLGIVHTRHKRTVHSREVVNRTRAELDGLVRVFDTPVNESTGFPEATGQGTTVYAIAPEIQGAHAYQALAAEIACEKLPALAGS